jgi:hypothetical protein
MIHIENNKTDNLVKSVRKQKKKKDDVYAEDQKKIFEELKTLINVDANNSFTCDDVEKVKETIKGELYKKIKLFFHSNVWYSTNIEDKSKPKACMTLIRRILMHFGLVLSYKGFFIRNDENERIKKTRYFIVTK